MFATAVAPPIDLPEVVMPYKRIGAVDDIGRVASWLASDLADYIHDTSLFVDGGITLYPGFEAGG